MIRWEQFWVVNLVDNLVPDMTEKNQSYSGDERGTVLGGEPW